MNKAKIIIPALVLGAVITGGILYSAKVSAASTGFGDGNGQPTQELADKLGIDKDKVATAMDEIRAEKQKQQQDQIASKLDQAVKDGAITSDQKQKLIDKMAEREKQKEQDRAAMSQWYKDNGIDQTKLGSYMGMGRGERGMM